MAVGGMERAHALDSPCIKTLKDSGYLYRLSLREESLIKARDLDLFDAFHGNFYSDRRDVRNTTQFMC